MSHDGQPNIVARYCTNPDCPTLLKTGRPRFICETSVGAYVKVKCPRCKKWCEWPGVLKVEVMAT